MAKSFASYAEEYGSPLVALAADRRCKWWFSPGERGRGASGAVVATDSASADADRDNGTVALYGALRYGRDDERAYGRVDPTCRRRGTSKSTPYVQHPTWRISMHLPLNCGRASVLTEAWSSPSGVSEHNYAGCRIWTS